MDLDKIKVPSYFVSTKEDHIALWQGTYRGALRTGGNKTFVLGASGHIAGIVNHPERNKYGYWMNEALDDNPEEWFEQAQYTEGSWWPHWHQWLLTFSNQEQVAPYPTGSEANPVTDAAPGRYVKQVLPVSEG